MKAYLVGGAVRDELLGRPVEDLDYVVVGATAEQMLKFGFSRVGADFPVFLHPKSKDEYALARTERKSGVGHKGFNVDFEPSVTLEQDLERRDLTINAIAKGSTGELVDPFNGQADLANRVLRHVSEAFLEDPLRVLRVARFAAQLAPWDFTIDQQTLALMTRLAQSGELATLTPERVFKETEKALESAHPEIYFQVLQDCQALEILMPPLVEFDKQVINLAKKLSSLPQVVWAALCYGTDECFEQLFDKLRIPTKYRYLSNKVNQLYDTLAGIEKLDAEHIVYLLSQLDCYRKPENLQPFIDACQAISKLEDYPQGKLLLQCYQLCAKVDAKPFTEQGLVGKQIADKIEQTRIELLEQLLLSA